MKKTTTKERVVIGLSIVALLATMVLCLMHFKPDWKYMIAQAVAIQAQDDAQLTPCEDIDTQKLPVSKLSSDNIKTEQNLMLINKYNPLPVDFKADLTDYADGLNMNSCMVKAYKQLSDDINKNFGEGLYIMSGYRSVSEQQEIFDNKGGSLAAKPGCSEHQTGLALDVYVKGYAGSSFLKSEVGQYINSECWKYGFIIRYPMFKSSITGIDYEPWHIRYVGLPHSEIIHKNGITLEEYSDLFEIDKYYEYGGYLISHQSRDELDIPKQFKDCIVSSDNKGGYYITVVK